MKILHLFMVLGLFIGLSSAVDVSSCQLIDTPGTYNLVSNITGAPIVVNNPVDEYPNEQACIVIRSSDITLDCNGYSLIEGGGVWDNTSAVYVNGSETNQLSNVVVRNCPNVFAYQRGVSAWYAPYLTVTNITMFHGASQSGGYGTRLYHSNHSTISDNVFNSAGIYLWMSDYSDITGNFIDGVPGGGPSYPGSGHTTGIFVSYSDHCNVIGNIVQEGWDGIGLYRSDYGLIQGNVVNSSMLGFTLQYDSDHCQLLDNVAHGNFRFGFWTSPGMMTPSMYSANDTTINNLTLYGNGLYTATYENDREARINLDAGGVINISNLIIASDAGDAPVVINLYEVAENEEELEVRYLGPLTSTSLFPPGYVLLGTGQALLGTSYYHSLYGGGPFLFESLGSGWDDADMSGFDESLFELWWRENSTWVNSNATLDTDANTLTAYNVNGTKRFTLVQAPAPVLPNQPPVFSEDVSLASVFGTNTSDEDLTVTWDASDPDGEYNWAIWGTVDWYVDGNPITVLKMPFEANGGEEELWTKDYSPYGNDGTVDAALQWKNPVDWWSQAHGGSYYNYGTSASIEVPHDASLSPSEITVEVWVKPDYLTSTGIILCKGDAANRQVEYDMRLSSTRVPRFSFDSNGWKYVTGTKSLMYYQWHHLVGTYDGSVMKLYINGQLDNSATFNIPMPKTDHPLLIGEYCPGGYPFAGENGEVRIYNRVLSADQIYNLYNDRNLYKDRQRTLSSSETEAGEVWQACVVPNDGEEDGNQSCSNTLTVLANTPPVVENVTLSSTYGTNLTTEDLTVDYDTYDAESQPVKGITSWSRDGSPFEILNLPFDGGSTSALTKDYSQYGNDADVISATWDSDSGHDGFGAYTFGGSLIKVSDPTLFDLQDFTYSVWYNKASGGGTYQTLIDVDNDKQYLGFQSTSYLLYGRCGSRVHGTAKTNQWVHLAWTVKGSNYRLYEDGVLIGTGTSCSASVDGNALGIGGDAIGGGEPFYGMMDDVRIYNRALSAAQVLELSDGNTHVIAAQETAEGEVWQSCVTPNDGSMDGNQSCSNTLTVLANTPPVVENVTVTSTGTNYPDEDLMADWDTYDADGDTAFGIPAWQVNSVPFAVLDMPFEANGGDEDSWTKDYSGYGNDGNNTGLIFLPTGDHDGSGAYENPASVSASIIVPDDPSLYSPNLTVEAWVMPYEPTIGSTTKIILSKGSDYEPKGTDYDLRLQNMQPRFGFHPGVGQVAQNLLSPNAISWGEWHHIVGTYDGQTMKLYVDGVLDSTLSTNAVLLDTNGALRIGEFYSGSYGFMGVIGGVRIYDRALTAEQVLYLNNTGYSKIAAEETAFEDVWQVCVTANDHWEEGNTECADLTLAETDSDGDGVPNNEDACPDTYGKPEWQGCPYGDFNQVDLHIIDMAKRGDCGTEGSCKYPIEGAEVRVYDRNDADFQALWNKNPSGTLYGEVFETDAGRVGRCFTGSDGTCIAGEESMGDFLVIVKYLEPETNKTIYTGLPKGYDDFEDGLASKYFQVIKVIKKDGSIEFKGGSKTVITGSMLEIISPIATLWDGEDEIYPFIFTSDSGWTVDLCLEVPQGYDITGVYDENGDLVSTSDCQHSFVSGETKVVAFEVMDLESPPPHAKAKLKAQGPNGKAHSLTFDIPGKMMGAEKAADKGVGDKQGIPFSLPLTILLALLLVVGVFFLARRK